PPPLHDALPISHNHPLGDAAHTRVRSRVATTRAFPTTTPTTNLEVVAPDVVVGHVRHPSTTNPWTPGSCPMNLRGGSRKNVCVGGVGTSGGDDVPASTRGVSSPRCPTRPMSSTPEIFPG